ncbi:response regulator [bacterium]|nr:MAG: response regulator [bacterium]
MDSEKKEEKPKVFTLASDEGRYRLLVENAHVGICVCQGDRVCYANRAFAAMTGYTLLELTSHSLLRIVHQEDHPHVIREYSRRMRGENEASSYEFRGVTKEGRVKWLLMSAIRIDWDGKPAALDFVTDLSDRRYMEETLRKSEARYRSLTDDVLDNSAVGLVILDGELKVAWANRTFGEFFSIQRELTIGLSAGRVLETLQKAATDPSGFLLSARDALKGEGRTATFEFSAKPAPGKEERHIECRTQHVGEGLFSGGRILHFYDITPQKTAQLENAAMQAKLLQSQRLETAGTLACGIAHDFNNILQSICLNAHLLSSQSALAEQDQLYLSRIDSAAGRGTKLVNQLLAFSRGMQASFDAISLSEAVLKGVEMLGWILPENIKVVTELSPEECAILGDEGQIEQILLNLAMNSRDAMPEGGVFRVTAGPVKVSGRNREVEPGDYVLLTVEDSGHGMEESTLCRIYDPFFTTKEVGKGSGIGMSVVYGIVRDHGGQIFCNSTPGKGTVFSIYFKRAGVARIHRKAKAAEPEVLPGKREGVLVVDDEPFIAESLCDVLKANGYEALAANSGEAALELYKEQSGKIDLVVLDLGMPGMGGKECLECLRKMDGELKIIVASGYDAATHAGEVKKLGAKAFISKPYSISGLLRTIEEILEG